MTIETTLNRISYAGDGVTTIFSIPFKFLANADLVAILRDADDVETTLVLNTNYTVTGALVATGGTLTMIVAPASGEFLTIYNDPVATQGVDYVQNQSTPAETSEQALDRLTILSQRTKDLILRAARLTDGYAETFDMTLPFTPDTSGLFLKVNADNDGFDFAEAELTGITVPSGTGMLTKTNPTTIALRTITAGDGDLLVTNGNGVAGNPTITVPASYHLKNYAKNAQFKFFQQQDPTTLTSSTDGLYGPDHWIVLSSGTSGQTARVSDATTATLQSCQVRQINAAASRFGIAQPIAQEDCHELRGQQVTFGFKAKTDTTEVTTLRAGIVEWTGTADTITKDIVGTWGATPTLIANAAFVNTPSDLTVGTSFTDFAITATLGSTFNNLFLFIWAPNTEAQNDDFYVKEVQLVKGAKARTWQDIAKTKTEQLFEVEHYFQKNIALDTSPLTALAGTAINNYSSDYTDSTSVYSIAVSFSQRLFKTPTLYMVKDGVGNGNAGSPKLSARISGAWIDNIVGALSGASVTNMTLSYSNASLPNANGAGVLTAFIYAVDARL